MGGFGLSVGDVDNEKTFKWTRALSCNTGSDSDSDVGLKTQRLATVATTHTQHHDKKKIN